MLVVFAGIMSGLTLAFMSMSIVDLEVLIKSGTPTDSHYASKILPVVKNQHQLLCTLLLSYTAAMESLPLFLHDLTPDWIAILASVTLLLLFGEIIPHAICSRYSLVIAATLAPFVKILLWVWFPVAYPISKLLDLLLGKRRVSLFRRAELKTLVHLHCNEAGKGGELSRSETLIISGALELTEKTAKDAITPIAEIFAIDINAKLDRKLINLILEKGHSRVPVYYEQPRNIIGLILVKNILTINPLNEVPVKNVTIRRIPRVSESLPLYDILNEFQKGLSHMAVVVRHPSKSTKESVKPLTKDSVREVRVEIECKNYPQAQGSRSKRSLRRLKVNPGSTNVSKRWSEKFHPEVLNIDEITLFVEEEEEVLGIITMEDVIDQLLKDDKYDLMGEDYDYTFPSSSSIEAHHLLKGSSSRKRK
ncbi:hypothetical protein LguiB_019332 [Lonicera macranthoides]